MNSKKNQTNMSNDKRHTNLFQNLLENRLSDAEKAEHFGDNPKLLRVLDSAKLLDVPEAKNETAAWTELSTKLNKTQNRIKPTRAMFVSMAAAASVALLIGMFFMFGTSETKFAALAGEHKTVYLPDSSIVVMNAETEIVFDADVWNSNREVKLSGEAFFQVKKGSRFAVVTPNGTVEVLGTSFNTFARGKELNVACRTGKVKVSNTTDNQIVTPGEVVKTSNGKFVKSTFELTEESDWRSGVFCYESADLQTVFDEMERQFNMKISIPKNAGNRKYSGNFDTKEINSALQNVCIPMSLSYTINGNQIEISNQSN